MNDLIEALKIFKKYLKDKNSHNPLHCEKDELTICNINPDDVSIKDRKRLDELGFFINDEYECFASYRFGSC